jgi:hypothetical protein
MYTSKAIQEPKEAKIPPLEHIGNSLNMTAIKTT